MGSANSVAKAKVAEFEVKHTLGRGAHSDVVAVERIKTKQMFAVKRIQVGLRTTLEQAKFEAVSLCSMNHPGVISAYDWWPVCTIDPNEPSAVHIQLELAKQDLFTFVQLATPQCLARSVVPGVARQLLSAVSYLHKKDIVHRDIKLNNVLVTSIEPFVVKLGDLSLANSVDECEVWPSAGTICTKAPECMHEHPFAVDSKSDIYSLGATLFCAATGKFPFCAHTVAADDKHMCDRCEDRIGDDSATNEHSSLERSHYTVHVCVSGTMAAALAALEPEQRLSRGIEALLLAMCEYNPANRPAASECLRFEVLQFRLRPPPKSTQVSSSAATKPVAQKRTLAQSSVAAATVSVQQQQRHQQKKKKPAEGEDEEEEEANANKENKVQIEK